jgi:hypothetical protein
MRTFVIADAHGHPETIRAALEDGDFEPDRDRLVFAGDFLDRGSDPQGCVDLIEKYAGEVLIGNHDLAVLLDIPVWPQEPDSPRYRPLLIDKVLNNDPAHAWRAVTAVQGVLVSHAGISARYERLFRETCHGQPGMFADQVNEEFREAVRRWLDSGEKERDAHAHFRGLFGDYGPFWFRPPPFSHARPLAGVTQVSGHSPAVDDLAKDGFYMIDPSVWLADLGEPLRFRYAVIEEGRVRVEEGEIPERPGL